jgi:DNA methylase
MTKTLEKRPIRERKTGIIIFRVPPAIEAELGHYLDPGSKLGSIGRVARKIMLEALVERENERRLEGLIVNKLLTHEVLQGEAEETLARLRANSFAACVTSPPYWRKRDYGHRDQLGRERTPEQYVERLARTLAQVYRVLKDDGTLWINIDDSYWHGELAGIPWRLALELQRRGWHWRAESVVVEVKCAWNKGVLIDMECQLYGRYLKNSEMHFGIYVVAYFTCDAWNWENDSRRISAESSRSIDSLGANLTAQAKTLSGLQKLIQPMVLDARINQSPTTAI